MKMTSMDLFAMNMVEKVFEEPETYIKKTMGRVIETIDQELIRFIEKSNKWSEEELVKQRYERFRAM